MLLVAAAARARAHGAAAGGQGQGQAEEGRELEPERLEAEACAIAVYQAYANCLEANVSCEPGAFDACTEDHGAAIAACPVLAVGVRSQFDACVP
ncbi:MAG: hypothetical protein R6X02_35900 [Enhygromyxa sp.]